MRCVRCARGGPTHSRIVHVFLRLSIAFPAGYSIIISIKEQKFLRQIYLLLQSRLFPAVFLAVCAGGLPRFPLENAVEICVGSKAGAFRDLLERGIGVLHLVEREAQAHVRQIIDDALARDLAEQVQRARFAERRRSGDLRHAEPFKGVVLDVPLHAGDDEFRLPAVRAVQKMLHRKAEGGAVRRWPRGLRRPAGGASRG